MPKMKLLKELPDHPSEEEIAEVIDTLYELWREGFFKCKLEPLYS